MSARGRALIAVTTAVLVLLPGCGRDGEDRAVPAPTPSGGAATPSGTSSGTASTTPSATASATPRATAPAPTKPPAAPTSPAPAPSPQPTALACAGVDHEVLRTQERVVAITVDLGGDAAGLGPILRTLSEQRVPATFFTTGAWARRYPDGLQQVAAAGHPVGNHTDTHPELTTLDDAAIRAQLAAVEDVVVARTGRTTHPLFRFPFGDRDARTIAVVNGQGYCAYRWTVDTLGWKGSSGGITAQVVVDRVLAALRPGEIVLMHGGANPDDGSTIDADALPEVIRLVRERGYAFTTLPR